jgi:hypothetical protein
MLRFHLPQCLRRPRPSARRTARPRLDVLEARDVPATLMIRTPYAPYGEPTTVVASLPVNPDVQQLLTYAIDSDAVGNSVTASVHIPVNGEYQPADAGLYFSRMDRYGAALGQVFVEPNDYDQTDHWTSSIIDADVSVRPTGEFWLGFVRRVAYHPDPFGPAESYTDAFVARYYDANGTQLLAEETFDTVTDNDLYDGTHPAIRHPKVGADNLGAVTAAWQVVTDVDVNLPTHGSTTVVVKESRWRYDGLGFPYFTPTQIVAQSFLDRGDGSFSQYAGDLIVSHDLATNASGNNVVAWDRLIKPQQYYYSAYLQLDAIRRVRIDEYGTILADANPNDMIVSQNADTYTASPNPKVAINDAGDHAVVWTYAPDYNMNPSQLTAQRGVWMRPYSWTAPRANEMLVVTSPNSDGRIPYPSPPQFYVGHLNHPVAMNNAGLILVGYYDSSSAATKGHRLRGRLYDGNLNPVGDRFSFYEADWPYAQTGVAPHQFDFAMDENGHVTTAIGDPNPPPGAGFRVLGQRFARSEFDVQHGEVQRSTVQYVDFTFNPGLVDVAALMAPGRVKLTHRPLNGSPTETPVSLTGALSYAGNTVTMNFGPAGLSDGYYKAEYDLNGDGLYEVTRWFYRKFGDVSGTGLNNPPWIWFLLND